MNIANWLKKNVFVLNVLKLITGTALGQVITVLVSPILARIYTPEDFGILAVYISVVAILAVVICLRFELAIMLPEKKEEASDLVILGILIAALISLCLLFIFIIFNKNISVLIGHPELSFYLCLVPLSTFFYGSFQVFSYWMSRSQKFNQLAAAKTTKEAAIAGTQLSLGAFLQAGAFGLVAGQIAGNATATAILLVKSINQIRKRFYSAIFNNLKTVFIKYKKFPLFSSWAALLNAISQNIPAILFAFLFSPSVAGLYAIAIRVLHMPTALIGNSVKQVYYQKASEIYNENQSVLRIFLKTTQLLALIAVIPFLIVILWGEPIFTFVFGSQWGLAGKYASVLSFWLFFGFINPPSVITIYLLELNKIQLIWEIFLLIFRVLAIYAGFILFKDVIVSISLFTIVGILFNFILIGIAFTKLKKEKKRIQK
ncbi:MAG: oligosaccharide flippase family protein [Calditrichia bacterium]|jgi:O-antigen/teichoic acid export membrane protein|nr:oligosaccharide flippase family protein [Calditrichia bacterium]